MHVVHSVKMLNIHTLYALRISILKTLLCFTFCTDFRNILARITVEKKIKKK